MHNTSIQIAQIRNTKPLLQHCEPQWQHSPKIKLPCARRNMLHHHKQLNRNPRQRIITTAEHEPIFSVGFTTKQQHNMF